MIYSNIKLVQNEKIPGKRTLDSYSHLVLLHGPALAKTRFPYADRIMARRKVLGLRQKDTDVVALDLPNSAATHLVCASIQGDESAFELLTLARKIVAAQLDYGCSRLAVAVVGFTSDEAEKYVEAVIAAAASASAQLPSLKSEKKKDKKIRRLDVLGLKAKHGFKRTLAEAEGNALARYLSMLPPNELTPGVYRDKLVDLASQEGWKIEQYDIKKLKARGAGAFLAVVQGSAEKDAAIVRLCYSPAGGKSNKKISLVGKGICYDTGGTNLKPANYMFGMHEDMQGSAVALGCFLALARLQVDFEVECWLALAMNHIGPLAYKPNDVVTAANGKTIEVVHTDAEGRMVLADTLVFASREKPSLIMDFATLTGACVYSIGTAYSGVFSNRESFHSALIEAGKDSGERVWPFPQDEDYDRAIKSDIADVKQCSLEGGVDHILAARFLQKFIENDTPWVHVDLSASNRKGGLAHIASDSTGFGVRFTLNFLLDKKMPSPGGG